MERTVEDTGRHGVDRGWQVDKDPQMGSCMLKMYSEGLWTDVKFICKRKTADNTPASINAHKVVLAARSPVFEAMFFGPNADGRDEVTIEHVEKEDFDLFLRCVYSDSTSLTKETALQVLNVAHMYDVQTAVKCCVDFLKTRITVTNACTMLNYATLYDFQDLKDAVCSVVDENVSAVLKTDEFLALSKESLVYLLKGDTLFSDETYIVKRVMEWAKRQCQEQGNATDGQTLRQILGDAFYHLRFQSMTASDFSKCTHKRGYFSFEEHENILTYICGNSNSPAQCSSPDARVKKHSEINILYGFSTHNEERISSGNCAFNVKVSKSTRLVSLKLSDFGVYEPFSAWDADGDLYNKQSPQRFDRRLSTPSEYVRCKGRTLKRNTGLFVSGTLRCREIGYQSTFRTGQPPASVHGYTDIEPLTLNARRKPYTLAIYIEFEVKTPPLEMVVKRVDSAMADTSHRRVQIEFNHEHTFNKLALVDGLMFENESERWYTANNECSIEAKDDKDDTDGKDYDTTEDSDLSENDGGDTYGTYYDITAAVYPYEDDDGNVYIGSP